MRTHVLCGLALVCAAGGAAAQGWPGAQGYYGPGPGGYPPMAGYYGGPPMAGYYGGPPTMGYPSAAQGLPASPQDIVHSNGFVQFPAYPNGPAPEPGPRPGDTKLRVWPGDETKCEPPCFWVNGGFTFGWIRNPDSRIPLVTTSSTTTPNSGALGANGTRIIYTTGIPMDHFSGIKAETGLFPDAARIWSIEADVLWLFPNHNDLTLNSNSAGSPPVLRPVRSVTGSEIAFIDALPGIATGGVDVQSRAEFFGFEFNTRYHWYMLNDGGNCWSFDGLLGYRYLRLAETLTIRDQFQPLVQAAQLRFQGVPIAPGSTVSDMDQFASTNKFNGGQVGARMHVEKPWWFVDVSGKVAIGASDQQAFINGSSSLVTPTSRQVAGGGILALPSNIGQHGKTEFGVVPEGEVVFGVKLHRNVQFMAGYQFLYWNQVLRPSGMIDRTVNTALVPTSGTFGTTNTNPFRPLVNNITEPFWVQTLSLRLALLF